ncbi:MAG: Response regulator containing a CheY-like protein receiver domain and an HD-GYP protein [uncultured bacterium]|uniref:Response regulatory domain-containing protein n=1 Tax=Candidatus Uhrbacteria bacterium RIFOXYB2_FULL_45_11 TaxID=1802421 RepID=A0A1F7W4U0_9BACT|nr:MAG: Response regulator containing a CheY-like protein receiver domain and an HD-GYP protein [uncultured bacterium]OGL97227.1 MAG: hypothetical protein A2318_03725 [Candidatus Uhrbacteria bacterium RIFOXYB2_FULL_45_11]
MSTSKIILVIEDEHPILLVLRDRLRDEGYRILEARNGEDGLSIALKEHPDLIVLDLLMPIMDGISVLRNLREDEWGKTAKVIVLTNLSENEKLQEAQTFGVNDYLIKTDWKIEEVIEKIKSKLIES